MMSCWFKSFVQSVESTVLDFLQNVHEERNEANKIISLMKQCKTLVPYELRVGGSSFTHMSVIGRMQDKGEVPIHFDEKDYITALVHLGQVDMGGSTQYFDGVSLNSTLKKALEVSRFFCGVIVTEASPRFTNLRSVPDCDLTTRII